MASLSALKRRGQWRTYTDTDGLPTLMYEHAALDQDGFIWFGSNNSGALRFDGEGFEHFTCKDGLSGHSVYHIHLDGQGRLWFATLDGGLCWWDGKRFHLLELEGLDKTSVSAIYEDRQGRLWFGGSELLGWWDGGPFHPLIQGPSPILATDRGPYTCWGLAEDEEGHIWYGTNGLVSYDGQSCRRWDEAEGVPYRQAGGMGYSLARDGRGTLWLGTGAYKDVRRYNGTTFEPVLEVNGIVRKIQIDRKGRPWICTNGDGIYCYDNGNFQHFTVDDGLTDNTVNGMLEDREGHFWFASLLGGISCYDPDTIQVFDQSAGLPHGEMSYGLAEDRQGRIWAGLFSFDSTKKDKTVVCLDGDQISSWGRADGLDLGTKCSSICQDRQGRLWFSGNLSGRLAVLDGQTVEQMQQGNPTICWETRQAIDAQGRLYYGYNCLDHDLCHWYIGRWDKGQFIELYHQKVTDLSGHNSHEYISALTPCKNGGLWFAKNRGFSSSSRGLGLGYLDPNGQLHHFTTANGLANDQVADILEDRDGNLWIATHEGLQRYDGSHFTLFTSEDGLPSNQILSLCQDKNGRFWLGTAGGLVHFDGQLFQTIRSPAIHAPYRIIQARDGALWLNTRRGLIRYQPRSEAPGVRLTQLVADRTYPAPKTVEIPAPTRQISFEFKGLSYRTPPGEMLYTYKLEGYDDQWQKPSRNRRAYYRELPPGEYVFKVRAIDRDLNYSHQAATARLTVVPDLQREGLQQVLSYGGPTLEAGFIGTSASLRRLQTELAEAASTQLTLLLQGETGTGKGLAARTVHRQSQRSGAFIQINCGAIPANLVESELFGHEKGAFTGAQSRKLGKVELAQDGTLFLDEIGDMPLDTQVKLLRLLEDQSFERIGASQTLKAQTRIVAATNRDLDEMVAAGLFRKDLYFRLRVLPLYLPPLRTRREDIAQLALHFMHRMAAHLKKTINGFSPPALAALKNYDWPGNVRELEHTVQRGVVVARSDQIHREDLAMGFAPPTDHNNGTLVPLAEYERRYILQVLEHTNWAIKGAGGAAQLLGLHESTLRSRMKKLGIKRPKEGNIPR